MEDKTLLTSRETIMGGCWCGCCCHYPAQNRGNKKWLWLTLVHHDMCMLPYEEWGLPIRRPRVQVSLPPVNCMKYHLTSMSTGYKIKLTLFLFLVCFWGDPQIYKCCPLTRHFHTRSLPSLLARAKHKCRRRWRGFIFLDSQTIPQEFDHSLLARRICIVV